MQKHFPWYPLLALLLVVKGSISYNLCTSRIAVVNLQVHVFSLLIWNLPKGGTPLWKAKDIFEGIRIKFHQGVLKGRGKRGYRGKAQNEGYFANSHKLLVRQTSYHHHWHSHAQQPIYMHFQVILRSSSWSKTTLFVYFLRNKYGFQMGNAMEKI